MSAAKKIDVYDLDGTLSYLNSTFDFIFSYHYKTKSFPVYFYYKLLNLLIVNVPFISYRIKRLVIISILFFGVSESRLLDFFDDQYIYFFMSSLTPLGKQVLQQNNADKILLTGCTEMPAKQIAEIFGFGRVISTTFRTYGGRHFGVAGDTYGNTKTRYINKDDGLFMTYYSDDMISESDLYEVMDEVVVVHYEERSH